jgi:hypothetical protein
LIQRNTQTADFWTTRFVPNTDDWAHLYDQIVEAGEPLSLDVLALSVIDYRCRLEEEAIRREMSKGPSYQPKDAYEEGQQLIFPAFDYALGVVTGTRSGTNPAYGNFTVIEVAFESDNGEEPDVREFASQLPGHHKLNRPEGSEDVLVAEIEATPAEIFERVGTIVKERLREHLESSADFVRFKGLWFLSEMLADLHVGHLNIAEAMIEVQGRPLGPEEILAELDLPEEIDADIQVFSLNQALHADARFDNVGIEGETKWYLRRLVPYAAIYKPRRLEIAEPPYDRSLIDDELLLIEREIDDEGMSEEILGPTKPTYKTTLALPLAHRRLGTLPLTVRTQGLFPSCTDHHAPVTLIDGRTGDKMEGWVVYKEGYVWGLEDWYERNQLPVGAYIKLERLRDPQTVVVDYEQRRLKRLWVRAAKADVGRLDFQMKKVPVQCDYDELMTIDEENPEAIDQVWLEMDAKNVPLLDIILHVMPELIKLSPRGNVHAKTLYTAVNFLRRCPPGPVFAILSSEPGLVSTGGGYYTLDDSLIRR